MTDPQDCDGTTGAESAAPILAAGDLRLRLAPATGGAIAAFEWCGQNPPLPLMRGSEAPRGPLECASFPLVPFVNRIRGGRFAFAGETVRLAPNMPGDPSPLHGQGWLAEWDVVSAARGAAELRYRHTAGEWPWSYETRQVFALDAGGLSVELECRNTSDRPMPCGLGQHPYFHCRPTTELRTGVESVWEVDADILPVRRIAVTPHYALDGAICGRSLDNGYDGWSGSAAIETPGGPVRIRLSSPDARFFQVYSPAEGGVFVAEPVTHANAALNAPESEWPALGLRVLAPGERMRMRMRIDVAA